MMILDSSLLFGPLCTAWPQ